MSKKLNKIKFDLRILADVAAIVAIILATLTWRYDFCFKLEQDKHANINRLESLKTELLTNKAIISQLLINKEHYNKGSSMPTIKLISPLSDGLLTSGIIENSQIRMDIQNYLYSQELINGGIDASKDIIINMQESPPKVIEAKEKELQGNGKIIADNTEKLYALTDKLIKELNEEILNSNNSVKSFVCNT